VALAGVVVVVFLLLSGGGSGYSITAHFQNASQLVTGNQVQAAGTAIGSIDDISLGPNGSAEVKLSIKDEDYAPLPENTVATIRSTSLSGIANRYVSLLLPDGEDSGKTIPDGGVLPLSNTVSEVDLDQLFNTFTPKTIGNLKNVIQGFARSYDGIGKSTNEGFHYLNPFLSTSRDLFGELTLDERRFARLIIDTSSLSGTLAERAPDIEALVGNLDQTMAALASENQNLARAVGALPAFMRDFDTTAVNLRAALDDLDPLVAASKPVAKRLRPFTRELRSFASDAVPAVRDLDQITGRRGADNDLTELTRLQVPLAKIAVGPVRRNGERRPGSLPVSRRALVRSLPILSYLRPYIAMEAIGGWFDDFGHSGTYDANGGFGRIMATFNLFSLNAPGVPDFLNPLPPTLGALQSHGFDINNYHRCPGSLERDPGDGSTPFTDNGAIDCNPDEVSVGPPAPFP
jgi:phospholipid/cholesterol/gamma-HCH transport system substrate-binding protein